jgi:hypothetical protein
MGMNIIGDLGNMCDLGVEIKIKGNVEKIKQRFPNMSEYITHENPTTVIYQVPEHWSGFISDAACDIIHAGFDVYFSLAVTVDKHAVLAVIDFNGEPVGKFNCGGSLIKYVKRKLCVVYRLEDGSIDAEAFAFNEGVFDRSNIEKRSGVAFPIKMLMSIRCNNYEGIRCALMLLTKVSSLN